MVICVFIFLFICLYMFLKNENTYEKMSNVLNAIHEYNIRHPNSEPIEFYCMKSYSYCLFVRFWDWGDKHVVPDEIYDKIKSYLK